MSIEVMKQALEALETLNSGDSYKTHNAASALRQAIEEAEKPWVKTYAGGKPNYTTPIEKQEPVAQCTYPQCQATNGCVGACSKTAPVHAIDMSQERVDKTAKREHDLVYRLRKRAEIRRQIPDRKSVQEGQPDRIADLLEEAAEAFESAKERGWVGLTDDEIWAEGADNEIDVYFAKAIEAKLKEKNNG